eukprot:12028777-Alexandrium_andersonii.AAC.1
MAHSVCSPCCAPTCANQTNQYPRAPRRASTLQATGAGRGRGPPGMLGSCRSDAVRALRCQARLLQ